MSNLLTAEQLEELESNLTIQMWRYFGKPRVFLHKGKLYQSAPIPYTGPCNCYKCKKATGVV